MIYIIGVGGVGSWLAHTMTKLVEPKNVTLVDGDTLEQKNLDRQLFTEEDIGRNKALALSQQLKCGFIDHWYSRFEVKHSVYDWLFCCVDNNPGRKEVLASCDEHNCSAIIAANEVHSSEAYVYLPQWKDVQDLDPRWYYPDILKDATGDVHAAAIGCTGEAQVANRQLVTANFMAAALASHLYVVWAMEARKASEDSLPYLPHRLSQNLTKNGYFRKVDCIVKE
jgi:molybdopterin/thiamine biosynthesis adenylyltransferase